MDCIDCHNRPSHNYSSPPVYFDKAMLKNEVSKDIPFIKKTAMGILRNSFPTRDTALMQIREGIINFYKTDFGDYYAKNSDKIDQSVASLQRAYSQNSFPAMKVTYDAYPEHIGHLEVGRLFQVS